MPDNPKRLRQLKLVSILLFSLPVIAAIYLFIGLLHKGDSTLIDNNEAINQQNFLYSKGNSFGFTDKERTAAKPKGVFRIAVLGDSFIWGEGLPFEKAWSHQLEKKLSQDYDSLEVLHWGLCGWSTLDEFNFFKEHGKDYDIDLLIIGWVSNDPEIGNIPKVLPGRADKDFPTLYKISRPLANVMLRYKKHNEYEDWKKEIYREKNLIAYQKVLNEFHDLIIQNGVNALYVMTPSSSFDPTTQKHFEIAKPMILKAKFSCLDLYASSEKALGHYSEEELQANPVNFHPGEIMTEYFASEVKTYLEQNNYLSKATKRHH